MNENKAVEVSGFISPLNRYSAVSLKVKAPDVWIDRYLRAAIPSEAQEAVAYFDGLKDADGNAIPLQAHGAFEARVNRPYGLRKKVIVDVDINIDKGDGAYTQFAYPLHEAKGKIFVRPNSVEIKNFTARNGPARRSWCAWTATGTSRRRRRLPLCDRRATLCPCTHGSRTSWESSSRSSPSATAEMWWRR